MNHEREHGSRRPRGPLFAGLGVTWLLLPSILWPVHAEHTPAGPSQRFEYVADWAAPPTGLAAVIPVDAARVLLTIPNEQPLQVIVSDENQAELVRLVFPMYVTGSGFGGDPVVYRVDEAARRVSLIAYPGNRQRQVPVTPHLLTLDLSDPTHPALVADRAFEVFPPGVRVLGMSLHEPTNRLYLVGQVPATGIVTTRAYGVQVAEVDAAASGSLVTASRPPTPVPGCQRVIADTQPAAVARVGGTVFVACGPSPALDNSFGPPASVVAVDLADPTRSRSYFLPGTYPRGESFFDPNAGEEGRMILAGSGFFRPGQAVWIFDVKHRVMVGQIAAALIDGVGVDVLHGRIYMAVGQSVLVASDRGEPLPQALPPFQGIHTLPGRVTAVPFNRRVIIPVQHGFGDFRFGVYQDRTTEDDLPVAAFPTSGSEDGAVTDPGDPDFHTEAQAFGFRVVQLGGVTNIKVNRVGGSQSFWDDPIGALPSPAQATGLKDGDRDLHFARVGLTRLSADEASGTVITADADARTRHDYQAASGRVGYNDGYGDPWPYTAGQCAAFGSGHVTAKGTNTEDTGASAVPTVDCHKDANQVTASTAHGALAPGSGLVRVGSSAANTTLQRGADGTVSAVSVAEARDVTIGEAHIGRISSVSRVTAFGGRRPLSGPPVPGAAAATYTRRFDAVSTPAFSCPANCDPTEVLAALTATVGSQFRVELPAVERIQTPGGAHAHAWRDPWENLQDTALMNQPATEQQVPALRVSFITDADLPSRLIFEFAATKVDATSIPMVEHPPAPPGAARVDVALPSSPEVAGNTFTGPSPGRSSVTVVEGVDDSTGSGEPGPPGAFLPRVLEDIRHGWRWLLGGGWQVFALRAGVWSLLVAPLFLAWRRRHLTGLMRGAGS